MQVSRCRVLARGVAGTAPNRLRERVLVWSMVKTGIKDADLAQLVEHLICNQGVTGSSPVIGTSLFIYLPENW